MKCDDRLHQFGVVHLGYRLLANGPCKDLAIGYIEQVLKFGYLFITQIIQPRIGKTTEQKVNLPQSAVPDAESQPALAHGQIVIGS